MSSNLIGRWRNDYGSLLDIQVKGPGGTFSGTYSSETGESGTYLMRGCSPDLLDVNQAFSLTVSWRPCRPTDDTPPQPSWHWVSTMAGVMFIDTPDRQPVVRLLHCLVASTAQASAQVTRPAVYTETLTLLRAPNDALSPRGHRIDFARGGRSVKSCRLLLTNTDAASCFRYLELVTDADGSCVGTVASGPEARSAVHGFLDSNPPAHLQSLALTALVDPDGSSSVCLAGFVDLTTSIAKLTLSHANAVRYENKWTAISVHQESFTVKRLA